MYIKELNINQEGGYMEKVIEVKNLYKLYRVGDEVVRALDGVDFNIYKASSARLSEHQDLVNRPSEYAGRA